MKRITKVTLQIVDLNAPQDCVQLSYSVQFANAKGRENDVVIHDLAGKDASGNRFKDPNIDVLEVLARVARHAKQLEPMLNNGQREHDQQHKEQGR